MLIFAVLVKNYYPRFRGGGFMEENRARFGHFSGIFRLIVFIILFIIIIFFVIRWVAGRRAENTARQAALTSQEKAKSDEKKTDKSNEKTTKTDKKEDEAIGVTEVPSGISDSEAENSGPKTNHSAVPNAGIGEDILATTFMISISSFLIVKNLQIKSKLKTTS